MDKSALIQQVITNLENQKQVEIAHHHDLAAKAGTYEIKLAISRGLERILEDLNSQIANLQQVGL